MKSWSVQDARVRFGKLLDVCLKQGPQFVAKRGHDGAVLVPIEEWRRHQSAARRSLKELLLVDDARGDLNIPARRYRARSRVGKVLKKTLREPRWAGREPKI